MSAVGNYEVFKVESEVLGLPSVNWQSQYGTVHVEAPEGKVILSAGWDSGEILDPSGSRPLEYAEPVISRPLNAEGTEWEFRFRRDNNYDVSLTVWLTVAEMGC